MGPFWGLLCLILLAITKLHWKLGQNSCPKLPVDDFLFVFQQGGSEFVAVRVGRSTLQSMNSREVLVKKWPSPLKYQYYRSLLPDVSITLCSSCNRVSFSQSFVLSTDYQRTLAHHVWNA